MTARKRIKLDTNMRDAVRKLDEGRADEITATTSASQGHAHTSSRQLPNMASHKRIKRIKRNTNTRFQSDLTNQMNERGDEEAARTNPISHPRPFRFLDLPGELSNEIYIYCLESLP
jgi:hypothetical protein